MDSLEAMLQKGGIKAVSDSDIPAPQCDVPITRRADQKGVIMTIGKIPDSYFNGDSVHGFIGAGLTPDRFDCKVPIMTSDGNFTLNKGAGATQVTCMPNVFSAIVEQLNIGDGPFYIRYTFGTSTDTASWHFSQPLTASFQS